MELEQKTVENEEQEEYLYKIIPVRQGVFRYSKNETDEGVLTITDEEYKGLLTKKLMFNETLNGLVPYSETPEEKAKREKSQQDFLLKKQIIALKMQLTPLNEKLLQDAAGQIVPNIEDVRAEFRRVHNELRALEGKEPRQAKGV